MNSSNAPRTRPDLDIENVHVFFKCHLDVGFTNTSRKVLQEYFSHHFPAAMRVSKALAEESDDNFVWTMPAWLVYEYLEGCSPAERATAEEAILAGTLSWHALPFTFFSELLDPSVLTASLGFSKELDRRFERTTRAARFTDIPGHSRGIIAPLVDAGIEFLNIGVNSGCKPPRVPVAQYGALSDQREFERPDPDSLWRHQNSAVANDFHAEVTELHDLSTEGRNELDTPAFRWKDSRENELIVLYHRFDYGSTLRIPGTRTATSMRLHSDNFGPHSTIAVKEAYESLRAKFPNARIRSTDLGPIAAEYAAVRADLPVLTSEIGDSWIYGTASDPTKIARLRSLLRARARWIEDGLLTAGDATDLAGLRNLIQAPEHNWGLNTAEYLRSRENFDVPALAAARSQPGEFANVDQEWLVQRQQIELAQATYLDHLGHKALDAIEIHVVARPAPIVPAQRISTSDGTREPLRLTGIFEQPFHEIGDALLESDGMFGVMHETFGVGDYQAFAHSYNSKSFTENDFGKPGLERYNNTKMQSIAVTKIVEADTDHLVAQLAFTDPIREANAGRPEEVWLSLTRSNNDAILLEISMFKKAATRMPEALWLSMMPHGLGDEGWTMTKIGEAIDPRDVVEDGGRLLHAVDCVRYSNGSETFTITPVDGGLYAPGRRALLEFDNNEIHPGSGLHFNLFNNLWGTAFPQWFGDDMRFRFRLER